jgi:hypothetical protein
MADVAQAVSILLRSMNDKTRLKPHVMNRRMILMLVHLNFNPIHVVGHSVRPHSLFLVPTPRDNSTQRDSD